MVAEQVLHCIESARDTLKRRDQKLIPIRRLPLLHPAGRHETGRENGINFKDQVD